MDVVKVIAAMVAELVEVRAARPARLGQPLFGDVEIRRCLASRQIWGWGGGVRWVIDLADLY